MRRLINSFVTKFLLIAACAICLVTLNARPALAGLPAEIDPQMTDEVKDCLKVFGIQDDDGDGNIDLNPAAEIFVFIFIAGPFCASIGAGVTLCMEYSGLTADEILASPETFEEKCPSVDSDNDGSYDWADNCPDLSNASQADTDHDGIGNICDGDKDGDGILNEDDNCPAIINPEQEDADGDGTGDKCEEAVSTNDTDTDGIVNDQDNCPSDANSDQLDSDSDGVGDACDNCEFANPEQTGIQAELCFDYDNDGVPAFTDKCIGVSDPTNNSTACLEFASKVDDEGWSWEDEADGGSKKGFCSLVPDATAGIGGFLPFFISLVLVGIRRRKKTN